MARPINILRQKNVKKHSLSELFPNVMFWDVDMDGLSIRADSNFIIQRVLSRNMKNPEFLGNLEKLYDKRMIKRIALKSSSIIGNESIEFIADRYHLDPIKFKKYIPNLAAYNYA